MKASRIIPLLFIAGLAVGFNVSAVAGGEKYQVKKSVNSLEMSKAKAKEITRAPRAPSSPRAFATKKGEDSQITAHCWTVSECNQMISDCYSVGGSFRTGITTYDTGATSEGSCTL